MNQPFFITGLPRSRSAWMANFFTTGTSFCCHDAMKDGWTAQHIAYSMRNVRKLGYEHVGDSDSGLLLVADELAKLLPGARWLFIHNTPERAAASYRRYFTPGNEYPGVSATTDIERMMSNIHDLYYAALAAVPKEQRMAVDVDDLDDPTVMKDVWKWLVPELPWDERRWTLLDTFRVNVMPDKITTVPYPHLKIGGES